MIAERYLIVNADDFGLSAGVNRGIIQAHEQGIVTSASLMVRWPAATTAAAYARDHPEFSIGLHVDLGEWAYRNSNWESLYEVVDLSDRTAVAEELDRQLDSFRRLLGKGPTHLDSHQHVHRQEPARSLFAERARQMGIPLRHLSSGVHYCGQFYGQARDGTSLPDAISVDGLIRTLSGLPSGITELACHPGEEDGLETMYARERNQEVRTLCDPRTQMALVELDIQLRSFRTFSTGGKGY
jgi:predicted glycoside hydrolase/deacetylase ChbG (UPF0249 family)